MHSCCIIATTLQISEGWNYCNNLGKSEGCNLCFLMRVMEPWFDGPAMVARIMPDNPEISIRLMTVLP